MEPIKNQEISRLMNALQEQINNILPYKKDVPRIEIDLIKDNLRKMYDLIDGWNDRRPAAVPANDTEDVPQESSEAMVEEKEKNMAAADDEKAVKAREDQFREWDHTREEGAPPPPKKAAGKPKKAEKKEAPVKEKAPVDLFAGLEDSSGTPPAETAKTQKANKAKAPAAAPADKPGRGKSIHDIAREKATEKTLGENIAGTKISSLAKAISINDKFQFINEFFHGKMNIYNQHITQLDALNSLEEALTLIDRWAEEMEWDKESVVFEQFKGYLERRY